MSDADPTPRELAAELRCQRDLLTALDKRYAELRAADARAIEVAMAATDRQVGLQRWIVLAALALASLAVAVVAAKGPT